MTLLRPGLTLLGITLACHLGCGCGGTTGGGRRDGGGSPEGGPASGDGPDAAPETGQDGQGGQDGASGQDGPDGSTDVGPDARDGAAGPEGSFDSLDAGPDGRDSAAGPDASLDAGQHESADVSADGSPDVSPDGSADGSLDGTTSDSGSACPPPVPGSRGTNPLFTDQFTADPAPLTYGCTFYIACGHDQAAAGQNGFVLREWFLLSSTDMVSWTRRVALGLSTFVWANANAWAGQLVAANGKVYWYVPINQTASNSMAIGVAVADSPAGPFRDALGKALIDDAFEMSNMGFSSPSATPFTIDPTVFVDDDGQAYLHYGGFSRMVVARLNSDMISINGTMREVTPQGFFEAPFLTKRNGTYYEIYAAGVNPAAIDYATSTSPLGPWTRRGRILDPFTAAPGQDAPTNHAGISQLAGQWYIVYHVSNGPGGGGTYRREVAVDKLTFNPDGTIQKVTPSGGLIF